MDTVLLKLVVMTIVCNQADLVDLDAHIDPHDTKGLVDIIKPSLHEEIQQKRMMLQQNGIEDTYPLDATIEYTTSNTKNTKKPIIATETKSSDRDSTYNNDEPDEDNKYNLPEYNLDTKADFQGNKEAAEWLMSDPNRYNVMPNKDSKSFLANGEENELDKQLQGSYDNEKYLKDADTGSDRALSEQELGNIDQKIIDSAYRLDEDDKNTLNKYENGYGDLDNKDSLSSNIPGIDEYGGQDETSAKATDFTKTTNVTIATDVTKTTNVTKAIDNQDASGEKELGEPRVQVTNDNDGISNDKAESQMAEEDDNAKEDDGQQSSTVYKLNHKKTKELTKTKPLSESGTSRQNVHANSHPVATEDPNEMTTRMNSFQNMMLARNEEERLARLYNVPRQLLQDGKVKKHDEDSTHDTPETPAKYGDWNGWSKCSVSCSKGTQMRARICLITPCESNDLYQTRSCIRNICPDKWREQSLRAHNHVRKRHHSPPLVWSNLLAKKAKNLANTLASMEYIGSQDLHEENGESVAQLQIKPESYNQLAKNAVERWYNEGKLYSFSYPQLTTSNRHFIQMIWKKTKTLGMASTSSRNGEYAFVVALYGGPGIDRKRLRDNVLRSGKTNDVYTTFKRSNG